jgi:hypothetical protein
MVVLPVIACSDATTSNQPKLVAEQETGVSANSI